MIKSKTIWFSVILAVLGTLEVNMHLVRENMGEWYGMSFVVIGALVAALRVVTTMPLSDK